MRPFWAITPFERRTIFKRRPEIRRAWEELKRNKQTDIRGLRLSVFLAGWFAAEDAMLAYTEGLPSVVHEAVSKALGKEGTRLKRQTKREVLTGLLSDDEGEDE
jgi:hypothetical protein